MQRSSPPSCPLQRVLGLRSLLFFLLLSRSPSSSSFADPIFGFALADRRGRSPSLPPPRPPPQLHPTPPYPHNTISPQHHRSKPLKIWAKQVKNGHIKRITDQDIQSSVLEIVGTNVSTTYVTCPNKKKHTLGIKLPFLVMIIKNVSRGGLG